MICWRGFSARQWNHTLLPARDNTILIHEISTSPVLLGTIFWFQRVQCFHFRHNFFLQRLNDALITFIWFFCKENYWVNFGHAPARGHRDVIRDIIHWFKRWNALSTKKIFFKYFLWYANRIYLIFLQGIIGLCTRRQKVIVKWLNTASRQTLKKIMSSVFRVIICWFNFARVFVACKGY